MSEYLQISKSQWLIYKKVALYYQNEKGQYVLYKPAGIRLDEKRIEEERYPELFIDQKEKQDATKELHKYLNRYLEKNIALLGVTKVKQVVCEIVEEALTDLTSESLRVLPQTIDILFNHYSKNSEVLKNLGQIATRSQGLVDHSVNLMAYAMRYCLFCNYNIEDTKRLSLAGLLHDIGMTQLPKPLVDYDKRLTEEEFEIYKEHPRKGSEMLKSQTIFDKSIANAALHHHERMDGSGYPAQLKDFSFEGQLIGLIDSFEYLTSKETLDRKIKKPFDSLVLIKEEVVNQGKFNKEIYKNLINSFV